MTRERLQRQQRRECENAEDGICCRLNQAEDGCCTRPASPLRPWRSGAAAAAHWLLGPRFLPKPTTTFTKRRLYLMRLSARPLGVFFLSCLGTLGVWPLTCSAAPGGGVWRRSGAAPPLPLELPGSAFLCPLASPSLFMAAPLALFSRSARGPLSRSVGSSPCLPPAPAAAALRRCYFPSLLHCPLLCLCY